MNATSATTPQPAPTPPLVKTRQSAAPPSAAPKAPAPSTPNPPSSSQISKLACLRCDFANLSGRPGANLLDLHDRIVVQLPGLKRHLCTGRQALAFWPVNFKVARLDRADLGAADVGSGI